MGVRFGVLGPVRVEADGRELTGLAPRHRAVLAYLLLHARTVLSADQLIDAVWGLTPPDTAKAQIQAAITAIRRVLREAGADGLLATRGGGYVLESVESDLQEFTDRVAAAQREDDADGTADQIRDALTLWRGRPLADVQADYAESARARLEERRLAAVERLADAELSLGRHASLIDELSAQVAEHPLRERLTGQLMLALYRDGRQPDALAVARTFRETLVEREGLDPGRAFLALEQGILRDDPALHLKKESPAAEPRRANFLPYDVPDFAGRALELDRIADPRPGMAILAIDGMAGIGKTALAVHAAHRLADRYPDGRLFLDLQAHTAGREPVEAGAALETLLRQLGVAAERIPAAESARAALWRAELTGRRVLVVLDNAADTGHVRPLLPGTSDSLILVTSRRRLVDLDGAHALSIEVLPARDGAELFTSIVGARAEAEPAAVLDVLQLCGFLPLAVRIAAARLHHRPRWTVEYLAGRLRDERSRLSELATSDRGVAAAFALSYEHLDDDQRRMFRLLGLHPGRDSDAGAAAALLGIAAPEAEDLLEDLLDAHVLAQYDPGRYTFHDLLREHARGTAHAEELAAARDEALTRLLDHYRWTAAVAIDLLYPYGTLRRPDVPEPLEAAAPFTDAAGAGAWLEAERGNLVAVGAYAADSDRPAHAGQLAAILHPYLDARAHHADAITLHTKALEAARHAADRPAEARALLDLAWTRLRQGDYEAAYGHARAALELCSANGDDFGESRARNTLGNVCMRLHRHEEAHDHLRHALDLSRAMGNQVGEAHVLSAIGIAFEGQDRLDEALDHHRQALDLHRKLGNSDGEARVLDLLGQVHRRAGRYDEARDHHRRALDLYRELGNRGDEAAPLNGLGETAHALGATEQAAKHHEDALAIARDLGNRPEEARAHRGLARIHQSLGDHATARTHAEHAHARYTELGAPEATELADLLTDPRSPI